jgi:hypothetical protein
VFSILTARHFPQPKLLYKAFQVMNRRAFRANPLENPMSRQKEFLLTQLRRQAETEYGRKYGFAHIETIKEYQERVPLTKYDDYTPYYERMKQGETNLLFSFQSQEQIRRQYVHTYSGRVAGKRLAGEILAHQPTGYPARR